MDTDLFTLQGLVVEQERVSTDLFSVQGIVIEKPHPAARVASVRTLVAQKSAPVIRTASARVLVAQVQEGFVTLPYDITGLDNFKVMTARKMTVVPDWNTLIIGKPVADLSVGPARTNVLLSPSETSAYRVPVTVIYERRYMNVLAAMKLVPGSSLPNMTAVIAAIRAKGILVVDADFDLTKCRVTANSIYLVAGAESYFFVPGSIATMGAEPTLAEVFENKSLNGFEPA
jgi:hypothetical protein